MSDIKPTTEQEGAANSFFWAVLADLEEGLAQLLADREHALREQVAELTAERDKLRLALRAELGTEAILAKAPAEAAGPWVVVDRGTERCPLYLLPCGGWSPRIAGARHFATSAEAVAKYEFSERAETLAEATAKAAGNDETGDR